MLMTAFIALLVGQITGKADLKISGRKLEYTPALYALEKQRISRKKHALAVQYKNSKTNHDFYVGLLQLMNKYNTTPKCKENIIRQEKQTGDKVINVLDTYTENFGRHTGREINPVYEELNDAIDFVHTQAHRNPIVRPFYSLKYMLGKFRS